MAVKKYCLSGGVVIFTTGRSPVSVRNLLKRYEINNPFIAYNGAFVSLTQEKYLKHPIDAKIVCKIMNASIKHSWELMLYTEDTVFISNESDFMARRLSDTIAHQDYECSFSLLEHLIVLNWNLYFKNPKQYEILKIAILSNFESELHNMYSYFHTYDLTVFNAKNCVEIFSKFSDKKIAAEAILMTYNISASESVFIGDGENDIELMRFVGKSIAMMNSTQKVKDIANSITLSNNNNGVSHAIEKYINC